MNETNLILAWNIHILSLFRFGYELFMNCMDFSRSFKEGVSSIRNSWLEQVFGEFTVKWQNDHNNKIVLNTKLELSIFPSILLCVLKYFLHHSLISPKVTFARQRRLFVILSWNIRIYIIWSLESCNQKESCVGNDWTIAGAFLDQFIPFMTFIQWCYLNLETITLLLACFSGISRQNIYSKWHLRQINLCVPVE